MLRDVELPVLAAVPGLVHGFGRRLPAGERETRDETRARLTSDLAASGRLFLLKQVHGTRVVEAPWDGTPEADASCAEGRGLLLGIETADCLPVLLVDTRRNSVAVAHAGWRGTAAGVAVRALDALVAHGSRPAEVLAALGPSIGACCYEVGDEVAAAFGAEAPFVLRPGPRGRAHLDLRQANRRQLLRAGLREETVVGLDECTRCHAELYHSYRRDGRGAGRMISYVGFRS